MAEISPMRGRSPRGADSWCSCCFGDKCFTRAEEKRGWRREIEEFWEGVEEEIQELRDIQAEFESDYEDCFLYDEFEDPYGDFIRSESGVWDTRGTLRGSK